MKYWYLKNGDVVGPLSAEEIKKDESFAEDSLVCPEDKAEQSDFWKTPQNYSQDFADVLTEEEEMEISPEVSLDDISLEEPKAKDIISQETQPSWEQPQAENKPVLTEEKNPFETHNPSLGPDPEETFSSHEAAPLLDAKGDTLLEDIPAKAILSEDNKEEDFSGEELPEEYSEKNNSEDSKLVSPKEEDTFEDAPILNIFERPSDNRKTKEIADISENIYNKYGSDNQEPAIHMRDYPLQDPQQKEQSKKNNKIFLLLIVMFIVVLMALLIALKTNNEKEEEKTTSSLPSVSAEQKNLTKNDNIEVEDTPTIDASVFLTAKATDVLEQEKAIEKVKSFVLPTGQNLEEYLKQKYAAYQTNWSATLLSGKNYCVYFNARKIRQEPIVYSFSMDLNNNNINGLNNLGMDLLFKGE